MSMGLHNLYRAAVAALLMSAPLLGSAGEAAALYEVCCTQCHGVSGDGNGINAPHMSVQPRDHTDPREMGTRTDDDLFKVIKHGGKAINKSVLMPAREHNMTDEQNHAVVEQLREVWSSEKGRGRQGCLGVS